MEKKGNICQAVPYQIIPLQNEIENTSILPRVQAPFKAQKIQPSTRNADVWFDTIGIDHLKKLGWIQSKRSKLFGLKGEKTTVRFSRERLIEILSRSSPSHRKIFLKPCNNLPYPLSSLMLYSASQ